MTLLRFIFLLLLISSSIQLLNASEPKNINTIVDVKNLLSNHLKYTINQTTGDIYLYDSKSTYLFRFGIDAKLDTLALLDVDRLNLVFQKDSGHLLFWDEGGGRVFEYNLTRNEFTRIDNSFKQQTFFHHASTVLPNNAITFLGGYGLWIARNDFIQYNTNAKEWTKIALKNNSIIPKTNKQRFVFDNSTKTFYYFYSRDDSLTVFTIDSLLQVKKFAEFSDQQLDFSIYGRLGPNFNVNSDGTYSIDIKNALININPSLYYDFHQNILLKIKYDSNGFDDYIFLGHVHFNSILGKWIYFGDSIQASPTLAVSAWSTDSLRKRSDISIIRPITKNFYNPKSQSLFIYLILLFIVGVIIALLFNYFKKPITQTNSTKEKSQDIHEIKADSFIRALYDEGKASVEMKVFDEQVFNGNMDASQITRKRNELIRIYNIHYGEDFIVVKRSELDKRYRILKFDFKYYKTS